MAIFADLQYCIYADIVGGWVRKSPKVCWRKIDMIPNQARTYLQLPLRQWGAGNVYLLVLSIWKVNIAENPIAVMGL
jgi:hypothetical protein